MPGTAVISPLIKEQVIEKLGLWICKENTSDVLFQKLMINNCDSNCFKTVGLIFQWKKI